MKKPNMRTKNYLDWPDVRRYLEKEKEFDRDKIWDFFMRGDLHNGCFVTLCLEEIINPEEKNPKAVMWFAQKLFDIWPEAVGKYGDIELYVWW